MSGDGFNAAHALAWMRRYTAALQEQKDYLTALDAAIGDADHGTNMVRGFTAVVQRLETTSCPTLGALFKQVGSTLISTVGGASGPLYGTAFLRLGTALGDATTASVLTFAQALHTAYAGVAARGKSTRGEKTLLDAFAPALAAFQTAGTTGRTFAEAARAAAVAAEEGAQVTVALVATKGRASFLGERSAGHQDPGATSMMLLFQALAASTAR